MQILKSSCLLVFFFDGITRSSALIVEFLAAIIKRDFWQDCACCRIIEYDMSD